MICETNEEYLQGLLLSNIVDDCIFEECIDVSVSCVTLGLVETLTGCLYLPQMMWRVRTNGISLDEIYDVEPLDSIFAMEKLSGVCLLTVCGLHLLNLNHPLRTHPEFSQVCKRVVVHQMEL